MCLAVHGTERSEARATARRAFMARARAAFGRSPLA